MKIYVVQDWRKKLKIGLIILAAVILLISIVSIWGGTAKQTITDPDTQQLQQDVLTQPLRVQAVPDTAKGEIPS
ncbi:MAG: hypothetical protein AAGU12_09315 [Clostridiales bacterium]